MEDFKHDTMALVTEQDGTAPEATLGLDIGITCSDVGDGSLWLMKLVKLSLNQREVLKQFREDNHQIRMEK